MALTLAVFVSITSMRAQAATTPTDVGISVTPALQDRVLSPSEKKTTFTVTVSNHTDKPVTVALSSTDFTALDQTGGVAFLGSNAKSVTQGHGLSKFLQLDKQTVTIPGNESRDVQATIADVSVLAVGGHYTAVIAKLVDDQKGVSGNRVAVQQAVSSLIFLETAGQGTKTLKLVSVPKQKLTFGLPEEVNVTFKATGNTQTIPRGIVTISQGDTIVQRGIINENSSLILPGSTRLLQTPLNGDRHPWMPGRYTLRVQYRYEGSLGVTTYEQQFTYINVPAIGLLLVAFVALAFGLFKFRNFWVKHPIHMPKRKAVAVVTVVEPEAEPEVEPELEEEPEAEVMGEVEDEVEPEAEVESKHAARITVVDDSDEASEIDVSIAAPEQTKSTEDKKPV